jgi:hypothetical protein
VKNFNVLINIGFSESKYDPCLWTIWNRKGKHMIIIGFYLDDCLIIGEQEIISNLINDLKNHEFDLKI